MLAVPYAAQQATALAVKEHLAGKVLIDVTVPLVPPKVDRVQLPGGRSAVEQLAEKLGPEMQVVAAFQNVGAHHLKDLAHRIDCDVLVCADSKAARDTAIALAEAAGLVGIHAGALANAAAVEAMTSVLIAINKAYKAKASGLRITGLPPRTSPSGGDLMHWIVIPFRGPATAKTRLSRRHFRIRAAACWHARCSSMS